MPWEELIRKQKKPSSNVQPGLIVQLEVSVQGLSALCAAAAEGGCCPSLCPACPAAAASDTCQPGAGATNEAARHNRRLQSQQQFVLIPESTSHTLSFHREKPPKSFQAFPSSGGTQSRSEIILSYPVCLHQSSICLSAAC